ncbi:MAG: RtcB family protein [Myxococcota bacterium]
MATDRVWLEGEAVRQLEATAADPDCVAAVGMPDLHPGPGIPIGAAFAFEHTLRPRLVGSDAGCGAIVVALDKVKLTSATERRVRAEFDRAPLENMDTDEVFRTVWRRGVRGLADLDLADAVSALVAKITAGDGDEPGPVADHGEPPFAGFGAALGTVGGGNHFAEIGRVAEIVDRAAARALGLRKGGLVILCHSGSRGLGKALADKWGEQVLDRDRSGDYLTELAGAIRFARANRVLLAWRLLKALGAARPSKLAAAFDVVHNSVQAECCGGRELWVHRKGCAPAHRDQLTAVLGSRGTPSWIMRGLGADHGLASVAHGAGRKMQRAEARDKLRTRYRRKQLARSPSGSVVICDDSKLLYEEHPDAYKPIEPVIDSLVRARLADRVAAIEPLITVKK